MKISIRRTLLGAMLLTLLAQWHLTGQTNAKAVLDAASMAMGASNLRSIEITGSEHTFSHGQES